MLTRALLQWISEVLHFCQGLPIILVGCKKDLRYDNKTLEELHKTSQKPVTPEQVCYLLVLIGTSPLFIGYSNFVVSFTPTDTFTNRARKLERRSALTSILSAQPRPTRASAKFSSMRPVRLSLPRRRRSRTDA